MRTLLLSAPERQALEALRDHADQAYLRERAAALLKIAAGQTAHAVAAHGLLKPRDPDSVYTWLDRYQNQGIPGLQMRAGRGRKARFFPSDP
jgi:transposase